MSIQDGPVARPKGIVHLCLWDAVTGRLIWERTFRNVMLKAWEEYAFRRFYSGGSAENISKIAFGSGATAVDRLDTTMETEVITKTITTITPAAAGTDPYHVTFSGQLDADEGNDPSGLSEIGLKLGDGTLMTHVNIDDGESSPGPVMKTSASVLGYTYQLIWPAL